MLYCFVFFYRLQNGEIIDNPPVFDFDNALDTKDPLNLYLLTNLNTYRSNMQSSVNKAIEKLSKTEGYSLVMQYKPIIIQDMIEMFSKSKLFPLCYNKSLPI